MSTFRHSIIAALAIASAALMGCTAEVYVQPATENIQDIDVDGESISASGEHIDVDTFGDVIVSWTYDGKKDSDSIPGTSIEDGQVWTVYASYVDYD